MKLLLDLKSQQLSGQYKYFTRMSPTDFDNLLFQGSTIKVYFFTRLIVTLKYIIKFLLNLPVNTSTAFIYKEMKIKDFKFNYNLSVLIDLYQHKNLIPQTDHDHNTRYKRNINICLPNLNKVFGQKSILNTGLNLCRSLNINIQHFKDVKIFKSCIKQLNLFSL